MALRRHTLFLYLEEKVMKYRPPLNGDHDNPNRPYVNGDRAHGIVGSIPDARSFNDVQHEIFGAKRVGRVAVDGQDGDPESVHSVSQAQKRRCLCNPIGRRWGASLSFSKKMDWEKYRKALRDISNVDAVEDVVWPDAPA